MARKSKAVINELRKAQERLKEIEALKAKADEEEKELLEEAFKQIDSVCEQKGLFCGAILSAQDVAKIVELAIQSKESIKIKYNLFFND